MRGGGDGDADRGVDLVRDTGDQTAERSHLFGLDQLPLRTTQLAERTLGALLGGAQFGGAAVDQLLQLLGLAADARGTRAKSGHEQRHHRERDQQREPPGLPERRQHAHRKYQLLRTKAATAIAAAHAHHILARPQLL